MDQIAFLPFVEAVLRIILGLRFISSGVSNVRRWPNATKTAGIIFSQGTYFFGFVATALMLLGGVGVALGFQTHMAAAMLVIFLIPTFKLHRYWLQVLPGKARIVKEALTDEQAMNEFRLFERQAVHSHETGWEDNLVLLAAALFFAVRGCIAFGLDNLIPGWVIHFF